jgi:hypothetical protein
MMRKIFGGAMAFSMVGAVVLGGVLAWSNSHSYEESVRVGSIGFSLTHEHNGGRIGPNDGQYKPVDDVTVHNTGGDDGFTLTWDTPHVDFEDVHNGGGAVDIANCNISNFAGKVDTVAGVLNNGINAVGGGQSGHALVQIAVLSGAPDACQGDLVEYRVTINMKTMPGS